MVQVKWWNRQAILDQILKKPVPVLLLNLNQRLIRKKDSLEITIRGAYESVSVLRKECKHRFRHVAHFMRARNIEIFNFISYLNH